MNFFKSVLLISVVCLLMLFGLRHLSLTGKESASRPTLTQARSVGLDSPDPSHVSDGAVEIKQTRLSDILNGSVFPETGSGRVNVDQLSAKIVLERRVADIGNGEVRRLFLVNGGGSYPYHRIEELVRYDAAKDAYVVVRQTLIVADHFMVKLRPGCTQAELETLNASLGTRIISDTGFPDIFMIQLATPSLDGVPEMMSVYEKETNLVLRTYVDSIDFPSAIPNDTNWASQWDKQRIACPEAWDSGTGSTNIIIAIIDTGIDLDHPDLAAHLWRNPGEAGALATNGIDDDHNGYVDDWIGWDFGRGDGTVGSGDNNPDDNGDADYDGRFSVSGHGTHCAGIAGAIGNNSNQVAGVCWNVAIMALKPFEYFPSYTNMLVISTKAVLAMKYAADKGAKVTSNSYGGPGSGSSYYEGIDYQNGKGVLFVAAAGNDTANNDVTAYQPAGVNLPNVIAVANSTSSEVLSGTSSYGATTVDIVAPGSLILSTVSGGGIATKSGTSMAAPQVAGAIALLYSAKPGLNYLDCKQALMDGVDKFPAYSGKCVSGGRLNVSRSLDLLYPIRKYPYSESFETGYGRWSYNTGSTPWITNSGPTPLPGTGPSAAADGTYYLYVQGGNASKTAILKTTFDFQALVNPEISWSYHMYGANIGQLYLEVSTNGVSWANPRLLFGNQGDQWFRTNVSLLAYAGMTNVQIRFRYFFSEFFGQEAETALDLISVAEGAVSNDSDNDGLPNDWETQYFGGATNANPNATASNGVNTVLQCYIAGLNPTNAASFFKATGLEKDGAGNGFVVRWSAVSGRVYSVYSVSNLLNSFQGLETNIAFPQSSYTDSVYRAGQFYKIDVRLAQ